MNAKGLKIKTCKQPKSVRKSLVSKAPLIKGKGRPPVCHYAEQGEREYMEDTYQIMHFNIGNKKGTFYGVFDGHGGTDVSHQLISAEMGLFPLLIESMKKYPTKPIKSIIRGVFLEYDKRLFNKNLKAGSTAAVILRYDHKLYLVNLGDSRGLIFSEDDKLIKVSQDHKPWKEKERNRIYRAGYFVNPFKMYDKRNKKKYDNGDIYSDQKNKKYFIYLNNDWESITTNQYQQVLAMNKDIDTHRVCNSLALSRAFGDFYLKVSKNGEYMGVKAAISPEPDVDIINLVPYKGKLVYVFLASDGFWDVNNVTPNFRQLLKSSENPQLLCKQLIQETIKTKKSGDNVSIVFDKFKVL